MAKDDPERIDLNLDEDEVAETPEEVAAAAECAVRQTAEASARSARASAPNAAVVDELARLQTEKDELLRTMVRRQADFENYKKRIERERGEERGRATAALIENMLPILDGFERALAAHGDPPHEDYRKGFELIYKQLLETLTRYGLEPIEAVGQPFDPNFHYAVDRVESPGQPENTVVEEHQRGYKFHDRVLRPSMVRVSYRPAGKSES
jgi:molecular chaperone GrpE